jgi:hypothetical protein
MAVLVVKLEIVKVEVSAVLLAHTAVAVAVDEVLQALLLKTAAVVVKVQSA